jgi:hypothetical protein
MVNNSFHILLNSIWMRFKIYAATAIFPLPAVYIDNLITHTLCLQCYYISLPSFILQPVNTF